MREAALLSIKVIDYACGSGHMLIGAGRRLARHLARIRTGDEEPSPEAIRTAMRDVVRHCLYGVDINEMAVELCKVALWMESLEPGKPLTFLDKNIQCGNSLIGVAPGLDIAEIPDDAFQPLTGDDKKTATALRARNRRERGGQGSFLREMFAEAEETTTAELEHELAEIETLDEDDLATVALKAAAFADYQRSPAYRRKRDEYDLWTAAFFWPIPAGDAELMPAPTVAELHKRRRYWTEHDPLAQQARQIAQRHRFFHWELAFPTVFSREEAGFDVVLSNPPWERIKLQEKEWFAERSQEVVNAQNADARKTAIANTKVSAPELYAAFLDARRSAESESKFIRSAGRYTRCGVGDINTYAIFAELAPALISRSGRAGLITPTGLATDFTYRGFFSYLVQESRLVSLFDFQNTMAVFPAVDRNQKFSLITLHGSQYHTAPTFAFGLWSTNELHVADRQVFLTAKEIHTLNPNTRTCPILMTKRDARIALDIYEHCGVFMLDSDEVEGSCPVSFMTMFHMANDSSLFVSRDILIEMEASLSDASANFLGNSGYLPLYEGKMIYQFDHRYADSRPPREKGGTRGASEHLSKTEHDDPSRLVDSRYYVNNVEVDNRTGGRKWFVGFREITGTVANVRTILSTLLPRSAIGNKVPLIIVHPENARYDALLVGNLNSFILDYCARQKLSGTSLNYYIIKQLPILSRSMYSVEQQQFVVQRVLELVFTAWDLAFFAQSCGYVGSPFRWDDERRFLLRCELDAAYFHLYGIARDDVDYVMETFPIVKRRDVAAHGEYRTKRVILEVYDAMQQAMDSGQPYQTRLDPPPADPSVAHPPRET
jgi:hypothetical protein